MLFEREQQESALEACCPDSRVFPVLFVEESTAFTPNVVKAGGLQSQGAKGVAVLQALPGAGLPDDRLPIRPSPWRFRPPPEPVSADKCTGPRRSADLQQQMGTLLTPAHLLFLDHALAHDLVDNCKSRTVSVPSNKKVTCRFGCIPCDLNDSNNRRLGLSL
jgi:hypothetical protein